MNKKFTMLKIFESLIRLFYVLGMKLESLKQERSFGSNLLS